MRLFNQRKTKLKNGEKIRFGDTVFFVNSDGVNVIGDIKRRKNGTLYFHNIDFEILDYDLEKIV